MTVETLTPEELATRLGQVQLADPEQAKNFTASEALCLLTMFPVAECEHCRRLAERPPGPAVVVAEVDRESGVVTFEARKP